MSSDHEHHCVPGGGEGTSLYAGKSNVQKVYLMEICGVALVQHRECAQLCITTILLSCHCTSEAFKNKGHISGLYMRVYGKLYRQ